MRWLLGLFVLVIFVPAHGDNKEELLKNNPCVFLEGRTLYAYVSPLTSDNKNNIKKTAIQITQVKLKQFYAHNQRATYQLTGTVGNAPLDEQQSICIADFLFKNEVLGMELKTQHMRMVWRQGMARYQGQTSKGEKFSATVAQQ